MSAPVVNQTEAEAEVMFGLDRINQPALRVASVVWLGLFVFVAPLLFYFGQRTRTSSSIAQPELTWSTFVDGSYMQKLETWLREDSPLTYQLRGIWSEIRFQLGLLDSQHILIGRDGALYSREILAIGRAQLLVHKERRAPILAAVRQRAEKNGVYVVAVPAPDSVTIYPENVTLPPDVVEQRAGNYALIVEELQAAGIPVVDLRTPLLTFKEQQLCYLRRDTHWTDAGAHGAALVVAMHLVEKVGAERLGPEVQLRADELGILGIGDLLGQLGMRSAPGPFRLTAGPIRTFEVTTDSTLVASLREFEVQREVVYLGPEVPGKAGAKYEALMSMGPVAVCGDSFSNRGFKTHLATSLNRLMDWSFVSEDAVAWETVRKCLDAIEAGKTSAKVVVWEFSERKFSQNL